MYMLIIAVFWMQPYGLLRGAHYIVPHLLSQLIDIYNNSITRKQLSQGFSNLSRPAAWLPTHKLKQKYGAIFQSFNLASNLGLTFGIS